MTKFKKRLIVSIIVVLVFTIIYTIMILQPDYKCSIVEVDIHSDTSASIRYEVENYTNIDKAYRVYSYIEKDGKVLASGTNYIFVDAKSTNKWSILLNTDRDVSFYGATAHIKVYDTGRTKRN